MSVVQLQLGAVQNIGGQSAVVIYDEIGESSSFEDGLILQPMTAQHEHLWVREDVVRQSKTQFGGKPIYGLWQVLLSSGLIDLNHPVSVWRETEESGAFVYCEEGRALYSGRYTLNELPADVGFPFEEAKTVALPRSGKGLKTPKASAQLVEDLNRQRRNRMVRLVGGTTAVCGVFIIAAVVVDMGAQSAHDSAMKELESVRAETNQLRAAESAIIANANPIDEREVMRNRAIFSRAAELVERAPGLVLRQAPFDADTWAAEITGPPMRLSFDVVLESVPGEVPTLRYSPAGIGETNGS